MKITKKIILFLCLLTFTSFVNAQITVTGKVADNTNEPIEFANVVLLNKENNDIIIGTITDKNGKFQLKTDKKGEFNLQISFVGFKNYTKNISVSIDLKSVVLIPNNELSEVVVTARKKIIERKVDRLIFNVENSISATGGDAIDALRVAPRIRVQNNQISMIGKSEMGVMVDDKIIELSGEDLINFLQSIPSDNIKSIEVISTPPAKYEAEGNSGLVNIVLKKPKENYWSSSLQSFFEQSTYPKGGIRGNINYQKNKLSFTSYINYTNGSYAPESEGVYFYPIQKWEETTKERNFTDLISGRATVKYKISDKWTLGTQLTVGKNNPDKRRNIITKVFNDTNNLDSLIQTNSNTFTKSKYVLANAFSDFKLDTLGKKLSVNLDYFNYNIVNDNTFSSQTFLSNLELITNSFFSQNQFAVQNLTNYSAKIDIEFPYEWAEFSFGSKLSFSKTNNTNDFFDLTTGIPILDINQSNVFDYDENTIAFYISAYIPINEKWESQIGLRYENTYTKGISKTNNQETIINYSELFPSVYLSYNANDNNSFSINYGRRINRPKFSALNPFRRYSNRFSFYEGNPFLQPQFINNVEFNYIYKNNFSSSLYYSFTDNGYSVITLLDPNTLIREQRPLNYFQLHEIGLSESYTLTKIKNLETYVSFDIFWNKTVSKLPEIIPDFEGFGAGFGLYNTIKINNNLKFSMNLDYSFPSTYLDSKNKSVFTCDIGMKYNFLKNKMQLSTVFSDIFRTNKQRFTTINNQISSNYTYYSDAQRLRVSLKYTIGNKKIKSIKRSQSNNEEKNRTQ